MIQPNSPEDEFNYWYWDSQRLESYTKEELLWHLRSVQKKYRQLEERFSSIEQNNDRLKTVLNEVISGKHEYLGAGKTSPLERKKRINLSEFLNFSIVISFRDVLFLIMIGLLFGQYFPNFSIKDWVELIASFTSKGGL